MTATEPGLDPGYQAENAGRLQAIWGEGFLSPGGPGEVARILGDQSIAGCDVLDIGSGVGGIDPLLAIEHGAATVVGVDVEEYLLDIASERVRVQGLDHRISYQKIVPGPLPFADASFDVVFSKDAILHVEDKPAIYAEMFRVLRPGGRLLIGDWLRGAGSELDSGVDEFIAYAGHDFHMVTLRQTEDMVVAAGFDLLGTEDRRSWYLGEAKAELERLNGPLRVKLASEWGEQAAEDEIEFWGVLVRVLTDGVLRPGHVRAVRIHPKR